MLLRQPPPDSQQARCGEPDLHGDQSLGLSHAPVRNPTAIGNEKGDENPEAQRGELRARVASRTEANGQLTFRIELWRELVYADDERRRPVPEQSFQFVDSQGRTVAPLGRVMRQQQTDREIFTLRVPAQELDRLEIRSLRSMEVRRMSFAFEDVPLR